MLGEKLSSVVGYAGVGTAVSSGAATTVFGLTPTQWSVIGVIGGLVIGLLGFALNAYFGWRRLQMDRERQAKGDATNR